MWHDGFHFVVYMQLLRELAQKSQPAANEFTSAVQAPALGNLLYFTDNWFKLGAVGSDARIRASRLPRGWVSWGSRAGGCAAAWTESLGAGAHLLGSVM